MLGALYLDFFYMWECSLFKNQSRDFNSVQSDGKELKSAYYRPDSFVLFQPMLQGPNKRTNHNWPCESKSF